MPDRTKFIHKISQIRIWLLSDQSGKSDTNLRTIISSQNRTILDQSDFTSKTGCAEGCTTSRNASTDNNQIKLSRIFRIFR